MTPLIVSALPPGRWCLGVSGGGDSLALAHLLHRQGVGGVWAHYNHRWSAWGDEAEALVRRQASHLGVALHVGKGMGKPASNAEAHARAERQQFFQTLCQQQGLAGVILAHTQTDVAENFLMRAGKGSGVRGLAAMPADTMINGLRILRPLLGVAREDLRVWLQQEKLAWLDDPDSTNQRAKIRALLPQLAAAGLPVQALAAAAQALTRAQAAVAVQVESFLPTNPPKITVAALAQMPEEVALQVLGRILAQFTTGQVVRTSKRQALLEKIYKQPQGKATLGGLIWEWQEGQLQWRLE
jgi:tRNA(Ile)-lysidine synthase